MAAPIEPHEDATSGSALEVLLESTAAPAEAPPDGVAGSFALSRDAGSRRTANAAVTIILVFTLIVAS
jgi:hypothetical protein